MKKHKFFGLIGASTALITSSLAVGISSSCSCHKTYIEKADTDVSIIGNNMVAYLQYTLVNKLGKDQKIVIEYDDPGSFTFGEPTVKNKLVTIPVYWLLTNTYKEVVWTGNIKFRCVNTKTAKQVWEKTISGSKVTYLPYCKLTSEMDDTTEEISGKTITTHLTFDIPTGLPKQYDPHLKAHFYYADYDSENDFTIDQSNVRITMSDDGKTADVAIPAIAKDSDVAEGASFKFDIQMYCMYGDTDIPIWISNNYTQVKRSYKVNEKAIDVSKLILKEDPVYGQYDLYDLVGFQNLTNEDDYNTLRIPENVIRIGDPEKKASIGLPDTITKISFAPNSVLTYIEENAFLGANSVKFIDLSNILDSVVGLDSMTFGANSFANWSDKGTIIWGSDLSLYKKHMLILDLYQAGLTGSDWYNIVEIENGNENESKLREACASGQNIRLMNDIRISPKYDADGNISYTGQIEIEGSMMIDLNGHTIDSACPIYDYSSKQFAIFGIWEGCDVVCTDLSIGTDHFSGQMGSVRAFNQSRSYEKGNDLAKQATPTNPNDYDKSLWDFQGGSGTDQDPYIFKSRECRCFYMRNDRPTKEGSSLEIMTGEYWGNCTTVLNWNGTCWIEDMFTEQGTKEGDTYKYAPQFHLYTPYTEYKEPGPEGKVDKPHMETLNCDNGASATGAANFAVYSAKFYAVQALDELKKRIDVWLCYDPKDAENDPWYDPSGEKHPSNWLAQGYTSAFRNAAGEPISETEVTENCYRLTYPES